MAPKGCRIIAACLAITFAFHQPLAYAGWMDDWVQSKSSTSPGYFEGQARGFATIGSFSARWPSKTDYPVSVQPPRISAGCGGIDFFGGSLSFLKGDQLVKKLQQILQNSEGVAFDLALNTLCPECSNIMKSMEDLSNKLNAMAMNDCQAARGVVAGVRSAGEGLVEAFRENASSVAVNNAFAESYNHFKGVLPPTPSAEDIQKFMSTKRGVPTNIDTSVQGCTGILADIFPSDKSKYPVRVMSVVGRKLGLPDEHVDLMRGLVGDLIVWGVEDGYNIYYGESCSENPASLNLSDLNSGELYAMNESGVCDRAPNVQNDLQSYVSELMQGIADNLKTGKSLSPQQIAFVRSTPVAVLYGLRTAVGSGQEASMISNLAGITASAWMQKSLQDLLSRTSAIIRVASKTNRSMTNGGDDCNLGSRSVSFKGGQDRLQERVNAVSNLLSRSMSQQFQEFETSMSLAMHLQSINDQIKAHVAKTFGPSVAARVTRGL